MRSLWNLNLLGTAITDEGVSRLSRLNMLGELVLADTEITGEALRLIPDDPFLSSLNISGTNIRGEDLAIISERFSRHLTDLNIAGLNVTDVDLKSLSALLYLYRLDISETRVTNEGIAWLKPLRRLRSLIALRTEVTASGARSQLGGRRISYTVQVE